MDIYYCGFNGFKQVPVGASSDTLTCLTLHTKGAQVRYEKVASEHKFLDLDSARLIFLKLIKILTTKKKKCQKINYVVNHNFFVLTGCERY
jgi:hypothetical protein